MRTKDFDKQKRIKEATVSLFLREGINGVSVAKIAKEAGVSPATIYVYYENKEDMLGELFSEYAHKSYHYLAGKVSPEMDAAQFVETLIRGTYNYVLENEEIFSFVEQCSSCPSLQEIVCQKDCINDVFCLIHNYQDRGMIRRYSDDNIAAVLFAPVRLMASNRNITADPDSELRELIEMMQRMLLY